MVIAMGLKVGKYEINPAEIPPLTLGDERALRARGLYKRLSQDPDSEDALVAQVEWLHYVLVRAYPDLTQDDIWALPRDQWLRLTNLVTRAIRGDEVPESDPFSATSTSSPGSSGGGQRTLPG
jgi:hypothetical protein